MMKRKRRRCKEEKQRRQRKRRKIKRKKKNHKTQNQLNRRIQHQRAANLLVSLNQVKGTTLVMIQLLNLYKSVLMLVGYQKWLKKKNKKIEGETPKNSLKP